MSKESNNNFTPTDLEIQKSKELFEVSKKDEVQELFDREQTEKKGQMSIEEKKEKKQENPDKLLEEYPPKTEKEKQVENGEDKKKEKIKEEKTKEDKSESKVREDKKDVFQSFWKKFWEFMDLLGLNEFGDTEGDEEMSEEAKDKIGQSLRPDLTPKDLARNMEKVSGKLRLDESKFNPNAYAEGTVLGNNQCANFVSAVLGIEPKIANAPILFSSLVNEHRDNIKTDIYSLKKGDVVFFKDTVKEGQGISHVGVVIESEPLIMRHHGRGWPNGIEGTEYQKGKDHLGVRTVKLTGDYYRKHFYAAVTPELENQSRVQV